MLKMKVLYFLFNNLLIKDKCNNKRLIKNNNRIIRTREISIMRKEKNR